MSSDDFDLTETLSELTNGSEEAADQLMLIVYDRMRGLARSLLNQESPNHTLQPTALVNEVFLKMVNQTRVDWKGKSHFFAIGAKVMRRILVDHARTKKRYKRGGGMQRIPLADEMRVSSQNDEDVLAIEEALNKLATVDARQAEIVELRFFGGLTVQEVAEVIGTSKRTVESEWTMAKAWLRRELSGETAS